MAPPAYRLARREHRHRMISHRRERSLALGPCMRLQFEDVHTVRYQIQEVLYAERRDGAAAIDDEIATYAHLVPDGRNWKATLQIEIGDAAERQRALPRLNEAVHRVHLDVADGPRIYAFANEDLPDGHRGRPSGVHFLRFQLPEPVRAALLAGAPALLGCADERYAFRRIVPAPLLERLCRDLEDAAATH